MTKFIKLTVLRSLFEITEETIVYYRVQDIKRIAFNNDETTTITIKIEDEKSYIVNVKESPEEILALLSDTQNYCDHLYDAVVRNSLLITKCTKCGFEP